MTIKEHIKKQREECLKYEVNSEGYREHWELLNFLCNLSESKKFTDKLISIIVDNDLTDELFKDGE